MSWGNTVPRAPDCPARGSIPVNRTARRRPASATYRYEELCGESAVKLLALLPRLLPDFSHPVVWIDRPRRGSPGWLNPPEQLRLTIEEVAALSPNERVEIARTRVIRDWDQLDPSEQARIQAKTVELRQRLADA